MQGILRVLRRGASGGYAANRSFPQIACDTPRIPTLERMLFRYLRQRSLLARLPPGIDVAVRARIAADVWNRSEWEAFESLCLPHRALRRMARNDPDVLMQVQAALHAGGGAAQSPSERGTSGVEK